MYQIVWNRGVEKLHINAYTETEKDLYVQALTAAGMSGTVYHKAEPGQKKHLVVRVRFDGSNKDYTYLAKRKIAPGTTVYVSTTEGLKPVLVYESGEMTESELSKILPLNRFKYIAAYTA